MRENLVVATPAGRYLEHLWGTQVGWYDLVSCRAFVDLDSAFVVYTFGARNLGDNEREFQQAMS